MDDPLSKDLEEEHRPDAVSARLAGSRTSSLSDWILGAIDGAVTTFAIVAGVIGAAKGFVGAELERAVDVITADDDRWVEFMLTEELGFAPDPDQPIVAATTTFMGFVLSGALPLAPFIMDTAVIDVAAPGVWSAGLTAVAFCVVGALKGHLVGLSRTASALRTLAVGGSAATIAFLVGYLLRDVV